MKILPYRPFCFLGGSVLFLVFLFFIPGCGGDAAADPFFGFALDGYPIQRERLDELENKTGIRPSMIVFFMQWPPSGSLAAAAFPRETIDAIQGHGAIPCLTWEPMYRVGEEEVAVDHQDILNGRYDRYLEIFAEGVKETGRPIIIRFAHEMNLERYHWGTPKGEYGPGSPEIYKRMFRYVVEFFREKGAGNALFAFSPNAESIPGPSTGTGHDWNTISSYYPGDRYVDILGIDGYNWGTTQKKETHGWESSWKSFGEIFKPALGELRALSREKPVVIFETASVANGGDRREWIRDALDMARSWGIAGINWFQVEKENDWRASAQDLSPVGSITIHPNPLMKVPDR